MLNKSVLVGRLTKDPLYYKRGEIMIATFCLAVERGYKSREGTMVVDFIVCKAFGKLAYNIHKYTKKGQLVALTGQIQSRSYTQDKKKQYVTEIICDSIKFLTMPMSSKSTVPHSKEDISDLISESAELYSEEQITNFEREKSKAEKRARDNERNHASHKMYNQIDQIVELIDDETKNEDIKEKLINKSNEEQVTTS
ncbi:single-stranded DNA-binding protein [Mammaliicoccus stepanovicii]|uniref:Single-stranded DNA-binding protein n=1 Tax=Mammaliicoccus stepanovicii TaxID=643214 RepID=A0A239YNI8_9STAP|nr:single-stranded DNA-binding protein [Mammaliicoccus stepanovicii]PNZ78935.1 single-stranded DNA-binding protein [Mammaliicoccus stepanovicii]GGI41269.1 hypothetical protein GCM10010896_12520 [Mammaliicoccus stepanovicii]SNV60535.1 single-stranded DNA-binding protein [Mammaliicoccus stepanovicii]